MNLSKLNWIGRLCSLVSFVLTSKGLTPAFTGARESSLPVAFPRRSLAERLAQRCRDGVCCAFDGVCCKVSIARGCLHLCVAQQLADHR